MVYERPLRSDELMHFGVEGMRWGIRRYQNADGSLTDLGRKRYGSKSNYEYQQRIKKAKRKGLMLGAGAVAGAGAAIAAANKVANDHSDNRDNPMLEQSIKEGKGKSNSSPAEKISKQAEKGIGASANILRRTAERQRQDVSKLRDPKVEKEIKRMSNKELQDYITRQNLERQYRSLRQPDIEYGAERAAETLETIKDVTVIAGSVATTAATLYTLKRALGV